MANLQDIIQLAKADGGKFFVMDEQGSASLVIMSVEEYRRLVLGRLEKLPQDDEVDTERINKEILSAQLQESKSFENRNIKFSQPKSPSVFMHAEAPSVVQGAEQRRPGAVDLREEVIDPSFDFEGPKMDVDDF